MDDFSETASGNRISKAARIKGSDNILISGYTTISANVQLNGDVKLAKTDARATLQLGKFVFIDENVSITPSVHSSSPTGQTLHRTSTIGSYVMIGKNTQINSTAVGNRVVIGANCKLGNNTTIYDCSVIAPNTTLPENTNIPPFSLVYTDPESIANRYPKTIPPSIITEPLHEAYKRLIEDNSKLAYVNNQFTPSEIPRFWEASLGKIK